MCDVVLRGVPGAAGEHAHATAAKVEQLLRAAGMGDLHLLQARRRVYKKANADIIATMENVQDAYKAIRRFADKENPITTKALLAENPDGREAGAETAETEVARNSTSNTNSVVTASSNLAPELYRLKQACRQFALQHSLKIRTNIHNCCIYVRDASGYEQRIECEADLDDFAKRYAQDLDRNSDTGADTARVSKRRLELRSPRLKQNSIKKYRT